MGIVFSRDFRPVLLCIFRVFFFRIPSRLRQDSVVRALRNTHSDMKTQQPALSQARALC